MKKIIQTASGDILGPFNSVIPQATAYMCDRWTLPYVVVGTNCVISEISDNWQRPEEPVQSQE